MIGPSVDAAGAATMPALPVGRDGENPAIQV